MVVELKKLANLNTKHFTISRIEPIFVLVDVKYEIF